MFRRRNVWPELFPQLSSSWLFQKLLQLWFLFWPQPKPFFPLLFYVLLPHHFASFPRLLLFSLQASSTQKQIIFWDI